MTNDVEPPEEVVAEPALAHRALEVAVRRGDDAEVDLHRRWCRPRRVTVFSSSTRSSSTCTCGRHVADLVEEERAAVGQLELALVAELGAGEGALLVAEQLALEHALRAARRS